MSGETGIVLSPQSSIDETFDPTAFFDGVVDADTAKAAVGRVKLIEDALKAAEQYGEYACKFCLMEAELYVKIAQVEGAESKLTKAKKELIEWIRSKSDDDIEQILSECRDGTRITAIKRRETSGQSRRTAESECQLISEKIIDEAKESGRCTLTEAEFYKRSNIPKRMGDHTAKAYTEYTRDKLLSLGFLGVGDNSGTYVLPQACERDEISRIVSNRLTSISHDMKALKRICDEYCYVVPRRGVSMLVTLATSLGVKSGA